MKIDIWNLAKLNNTMYAAAAVATEMEPWWKTRLEGKLKELSWRNWEKKYYQET